MLLTSSASRKITGIDLQTINIQPPSLLGAKMIQFRPQEDGSYVEVASLSINLIGKDLLTAEHGFDSFQKGDIYQVQQPNAAGNLFRFNLLPHRISAISPTTDACLLKLGSLVDIIVPPENRSDGVLRPFRMIPQNPGDNAAINFAQQLTAAPMDFKKLNSRFQQAFTAASDIAMDAIHQWMTHLATILQLDRTLPYPIIVMTDTSMEVPSLPGSQAELPIIATSSEGSHIFELLIQYIIMQYYFMKTNTAAAFKQKIMALKSPEQALASTNKAYFDGFLQSISAQAFPPAELSLRLKRDLFVSVLVIELIGTPEDEFRLMTQLAEVKAHYTTAQIGNQIIDDAISDVVQYMAAGNSTSVDPEAQSNNIRMKKW